jgi:hypothetical protein
MSNSDELRARWSARALDGMCTRCGVWSVFWAPMPGHPAMASGRDQADYRRAERQTRSGIMTTNPDRQSCETCKHWTGGNAVHSVDDPSVVLARDCLWHRDNVPAWFARVRMRGVTQMMRTDGRYCGTWEAKE